MTFRSYLDGSTRFMGPETSMEVQAALHSDIALVFDECTPFHGGRDYTARSTERTHRWLDRCLRGTQARPDGPACVRDRPGRGGGGPAPRFGAGGRRAAGGGIAIGGTLGEEKAQMFEVVDWAIDELDEQRPRHLLGIGEVDDLVRGVELGIDTFDCAMPTRIGRHGMALVPDPGEPLARRPRQGALPHHRRAAARGLSLPGVRPRLQPRRTCTTCSRRTSRPPSGCSPSTTSPISSG